MDKKQSIALQTAATISLIESLIDQLWEIEQDLTLALIECEHVVGEGVINLALLPKALSRAAHETGYHSRNLTRLLEQKLSAIG